jgi:GT2 family glycosyltransferase
VTERSCSTKRRPRTGRNRYRDLIHQLNQRCHEQWERAERLEGELAQARSGWLGSLRAWLRHLKRAVRPIQYTGRPTSRAGELRDVPCQRLDEGRGPVSGRVSIIVAFKDQLGLLRGCLRSLAHTSYRDFDVVLVDNGSQGDATRRYLERARARRRTCVVDRPGPFNFSWLCNEGARCAQGDYLLFLNNDTEVLHPDWLERLLRVAARPEVGVVGATLLYPDGTLQHAGLFPRHDGQWIHGYRNLSAHAAGDQGELAHVRTVPAVTGACLLVRRDFFWALGGFEEKLPVSYGDVDLCCRARQQGRLVVVTPHARLIHFEALSRGYTSDRPGADHLSELGRFPPQG